MHFNENYSCRKVLLAQMYWFPVFIYNKRPRSLEFLSINISVAIGYLYNSWCENFSTESVNGTQQLYQPAEIWLPMYLFPLVTITILIIVFFNVATYTLTIPPKKKKKNYVKTTSKRKRGKKPRKQSNGSWEITYGRLTRTKTITITG